MHIASICSLYRTYLRQVRTLPHSYLRHFFTIKGADDFRSLLNTKSVDLRKKKLKRVSKDLQRLRAANRGTSTAFDSILNIAYGRVGRLRWELMKPLLSDSTTSSNLSLVNSKGKISLPAYSPELVSLLTSSVSHTTRPLRKHQLASPPGLQGGGKPESRALLGPPSRRREHNIRWHFFKNEWKKVYPPLQLSLQQSGNHFNANHPLKSSFQDSVILHELLTLGDSPSTSGPLKRPQNDTISFDGCLSVRWLRRRYQALLGRVPLLIPLTQDSVKYTYDVQLADNAIANSRSHLSRLRCADIDDVSWIGDMYGSKRHE